jgi:hypothetical protein
MMKSKFKLALVGALATSSLFFGSANAAQDSLPGDVTIVRLGINAGNGYVFFDFQGATPTTSIATAKGCAGPAFYMLLDTPAKRALYNSAQAALLAGKKLRSFYFDKNDAGFCTVVQFEAAI